jgi:protein TonB
MPSSSTLARHGAATAIGALGMVGVAGLSLGMNAEVARRAPEPVTMLQEIAAPPKAKTAERARARRATPARRAARAAPSPSALLAVSLPGLDFGLDAAADAALAAATDALVADASARVVDEGQVEVAPRPVEREPPSFPPRARALGQSGWVAVVFVVDIDGTTQDVSVVESVPPGVFDDAAVEAVKGWRFEPGRVEGAPVPVRVRQSLKFALE